MGLLKWYFSSPSVSCGVSIEFRHVQVASNTTLGGLYNLSSKDKPPKGRKKGSQTKGKGRGKSKGKAQEKLPWAKVILTSKNFSGVPLTFAADLKHIEKMLASDLTTPCPEEDPTLTAWEKFMPCVRTKAANVDVIALLPDGRPFMMDFNGQERSLMWMEAILRARFPSQFSPDWVVAYAPCRCGSHWRPLPHGVMFPPGKCLTIGLLPASPTEHLCPEFYQADVTVPLKRPVPKAMPVPLQGKSKAPATPERGTKGKPRGIIPKHDPYKSQRRDEDTESDEPKVKNFRPPLPRNRQGRSPSAPVSDPGSRLRDSQENEKPDTLKKPRYPGPARQDPWNHGRPGHEGQKGRRDGRR